MNVPDNYAADLYAEDCRQAAADKRRAAYPQCRCCGHSIFGCETYRRFGDVYICGDCDSIGEAGRTDELEV